MATQILQAKFSSAKKRELFIPNPALIQLRDKPNVRPSHWWRPRK